MMSWQYIQPKINIILYKHLKKMEEIWIGRESDLSYGIAYTITFNAKILKGRGERMSVGSTRAMINRLKVL